VSTPARVRCASSLWLHPSATRSRVRRTLTQVSQPPGASAGRLLSLRLWTTLRRRPRLVASRR
jgi:hypothetical protein